MKKKHYKRLLEWVEKHYCS